MKILTIDPSVENMGYAVFDKASKNLIGHGLIHPDKESKKDELSRYYNIIDKVYTIYDKYDCGLIIMEVPEHRVQGGYMARESGAMHKLTFFCGMLFGSFDQDKIKGYTPKEWKGSLPKHVMTLRIAKNHPKLKKLLIDEKDIYKCVDCSNKHQKVDHARIVLNHNIIDAVGIGIKYLYGQV